MIDQEYRDIANKVVDLFDKNPHLAGTGNRESTAKILKSFADLADEFGYWYCPCPEVGNKEWLYDFMWFKNNEANDMLNEVALVLESEWGLYYDEVRYDFEKLLIANAPVKVMVFQSWYTKANEAFQRMETSIHSFRGGNPAIYILACFENSKFKVKKIEHPKSQNVTAVVRTAAAIQ